MEDGSNPWTWLIFFYVNHIYVFLDSQKNTIVLRYYLYLMDFLQEKMQHSKKRNIYIQKDFQVQISKIWRVARKSNPPIFLHVGFFEAPSFFVLVYHHPKGKAPIVFYMFFSISMGVSIYIYILYMFTHLPPWKPFTNLPHQPFTNPINPSIPELPDLQGHPHDNTRRAWLQGLDWSCPGEQPIQNGKLKICRPCCCFVVCPKKRLTFCWKPGNNPHQKKKRESGHSWEKPLKIIECSILCSVGNCPGYKQTCEAQHKLLTLIPSPVVRLESGCWLTHQRSMVDKAIPARRPKIRVHQPERDSKCVKMNLFLNTKDSGSCFKTNAGHMV